MKRLGYGRRTDKERKTENVQKDIREDGDEEVERRQEKQTKRQFKTDLRVDIGTKYIPRTNGEGRTDKLGWIICRIDKEGCKGWKSIENSDRAGWIHPTNLTTAKTLCL